MFKLTIHRMYGVINTLLQSRIASLFNAREQPCFTTWQTPKDGI